MSVSILSLLTDTLITGELCVWMSVSILSLLTDTLITGELCVWMSVSILSLLTDELIIGGALGVCGCVCMRVSILGL